MEIYAADYGIAGLVMPTELSKIINDFARVKKPTFPVGVGTNTCAICFGKNKDSKKLDSSRYCKSCYYRYGNGGFGDKNTYKKFDKCIKCETSNSKLKCYDNCPLCIRCYHIERKKIAPFIGENNCECGKKKGKSFPTCFTCLRLTVGQTHNTRPL